MVVTLIFLSVLIGGMVIGMPIAHSLVLTGVALMWYLDFFDTQLLAQNLQAGLAGGAAPVAQAAPAAPVGVKPEEVMATLEKLADLKAKGILTQEEFDAKKAELLKKLV